MRQMKPDKGVVDKLVAACDRMWRKIILITAGGRCEMCGKYTPGKGEIIWIQACHIISRRFWSTRWDLRNGVAGCQDCHDHKTIMAWLEENRPEQYVWICEKKRRILAGEKHRIDLQAIYENLQDANVAL